MPTHTTQHQETETLIKQNKLTKEQIFKNEKYTLIELRYGYKVVLPQKEGIALAALINQAELVEFNGYSDDITIKCHEPVNIYLKTITKETYQMAKVKALLMPQKEDTNETDNGST